MPRAMPASGVEAAQQRLGALDVLRHRRCGVVGATAQDRVDDGAVLLAGTVLVTLGAALFGARACFALSGVAALFGIYLIVPVLHGLV